MLQQKMIFPAALLIDRTVLQHERRLLNRSYQPYNSLHLDLLRDLFQLSTSHYSEVSSSLRPLRSGASLSISSHTHLLLLLIYPLQVRIRAQNILSQGVHVFTYSYMHLIDDIVELLKESSDVTHDQFKGKVKCHFLGVLLFQIKQCVVSQTNL